MWAPRLCELGARGRCRPERSDHRPPYESVIVVPWLRVAPNHTWLAHNRSAATAAAANRTECGEYDVAVNAAAHVLGDRGHEQWSFLILMTTTWPAPRTRSLPCTGRSRIGPRCMRPPERRRPRYPGAGCTALRQTPQD